MGFGKDPPLHVQNMPASCVGEPTPCNFVNGFLTPSANPNILYGALVQVPHPAPNPLRRCASLVRICAHLRRPMLRFIAASARRR